MHFDKPTLITLTAPTCSGKSFLLEFLTDQITPTRREYIQGMCERIVSTTTRAPRRGEEEGKDYHFISDVESRNLEEQGAFAELITFRGTRYGVTHGEMKKKLASARPPIVVLEPQGLAAYEKYCAENNYGIFKVFVYTPEDVRIQRLNERTQRDLHDAAVDQFGINKVVTTHTDRLLSITGDERRWQASNRWDAIITGLDHIKAIAELKQGVKWRNQRSREPAPYEHATF